MEYQELLWMIPDKEGVLKRMHVGETTNSWQTRKFLVKDNFLFYFEIPNQGNVNEKYLDPEAVLPLKACKVDFSPITIKCDGGDAPPAIVFVIFLPNGLVKRGVLERNTYFLGSDSFAECNSWMKAIRFAARSKRATKAQLQHAKMELLDLKKQWSMLGGNDGEPNQEIQKLLGSFGVGKVFTTSFLKSQKENSIQVHLESSHGINAPLAATYEESVLLQALSDNLVIQYSFLQIEKEGLEKAKRRAKLALEQTHKLNILTTMLTEKLIAHKWMESIKDDLNACAKKMDQLIPKKLLLQSLHEKVEFLQGHHDGGGVVPILTDAETVLLKTLEDLTNLEDDHAELDGNEELVSEGEINNLFESMMPFQETHLQLMATIIRPTQIEEKSEEKMRDEITLKTIGKDGTYQFF